MKRLRATYGFLLSVVVAMLALVVAALSFWLREGLREQILRREAATLHAVTIWQRALEKERVSSLGLPAADQEFALLALAASRLPNVIGVEVFSPEGKPLSGLGGALDFVAPSSTDWRQLKTREPIARLLASASVLEVTVPLHEPDADPVSGALRFHLDAANLQHEFAALDGRLLRQGFAVWLCASLALAATLAWVFVRLARTEAALLARRADLEQANRELTFAAKTSALGAITAHLVHGLRNPVAGLANLDAPASAGDAESLREASAAARRIRQMVEQTVALLQEENSGATHAVPASELVHSVAAELLPLARARGVDLRAEPQTAAACDNRRAALCLAILRDLGRNACEASSAGGRVIIGASTAANALVLTVTDDGPGLPPQVAAHLFEPTRSTKPHGAGIGLAICHRLAQHAGARLIHESPGARGARFRLVLPCASPTHVQ